MLFFSSDFSEDALIRKAPLYSPANMSTPDRILLLHSSFFNSSYRRHLQYMQEETYSNHHPIFTLFSCLACSAEGCTLHI